MNSEPDTRAVTLCTSGAALGVGNGAVIFLFFFPESTCDPDCDPVTCDLPGIIETTELEHLDLQDQYLCPRYLDLSRRTWSSGGRFRRLSFRPGSLWTPEGLRWLSIPSRPQPTSQWVLVQTLQPRLGREPTGPLLGSCL